MKDNATKDEQQKDQQRKEDARLLRLHVIFNFMMAKLDKGQRIQKHGTKTTNMYFILDGEVEVKYKLKQSPNLKKMLLKKDQGSIKFKDHTKN